MLDWKIGVVTDPLMRGRIEPAWMAFVDRDLDPADAWFLIGPKGPDAAVSTDGRAWTITRNAAQAGFWVACLIAVVVLGRSEMAAAAHMQALGSLFDSAWEDARVPADEDHRFGHGLGRLAVETLRAVIDAAGPVADPDPLDVGLVIRESA